MSAINLYINEEKVSYEIRQDVIIIKEKDNVIFEVPIPTGYHLLGILDDGNNKKGIVIAPYELKKPNYIPDDFRYAHFVLPVIDEEACKKVLVRSLNENRKF